MALWGKKILEWSNTLEYAYSTTFYFNNKYFLDGRDPNSYANVAPTSANTIGGGRSEKCSARCATCPPRISSAKPEKYVEKEEERIKEEVWFQI